MKRRTLKRIAEEWCENFNKMNKAAARKEVGLKEGISLYEVSGLTGDEMQCVCNMLDLEVEYRTKFIQTFKTIFRLKGKCSLLIKDLEESIKVPNFSNLPKCNYLWSKIEKVDLSEKEKITLISDTKFFYGRLYYPGNLECIYFLVAYDMCFKVPIEKNDLSNLIVEVN